MAADACPWGAPVDLPRFRPRMPWLGGDLQTLRNFVTWRQPDLSPYPAERLAFGMRDGSGDALIATLNRPVLADEGRPLVVLIHGLTGCEASSYILFSAAHLLAQGYAVLRLNLRGAGPSRALCRLRYHAGRVGDLAEALRGLAPALIGGGLALVGYSLGGNMLLKFLAVHGGDFPIRAAVSVSAPIDLAAASRRIMARRNGAYHAWLLARMKFDFTGPRAVLTEAENATLAAARTVWEFDDHIVAPRNGYAGAEAYYGDNMALRFLPAIRVRTLIVHAADDPWIPARAHRDFDWAGNRYLQLALTHSGGHVGFHGAGHAAAWHDRAISVFFRFWEKSKGRSH